MTGDHDDFYDDEIPEGMVICDKCNGDGTIDCMCCGDFCCCGANDELDCPVCHGEQYITKERWERRAKAHREIMKALWGDQYDSKPSEAPNAEARRTDEGTPVTSPSEAPSE